MTRSTIPVAYVYEADYHCPGCAIKRFGEDDRGPWAKEDAVDSEGNLIGAIFSWMAANGMVCGTCHLAITRKPDLEPPPLTQTTIFDNKVPVSADEERAQFLREGGYANIEEWAADSDYEPDGQGGWLYEDLPVDIEGCLDGAIEASQIDD